MIPTNVCGLVGHGSGFRFSLFVRDHVQRKTIYFFIHYVYFIFRWCKSLFGTLIYAYVFYAHTLGQILGNIVCISFRYFINLVYFIYLSFIILLYSILAALFLILSSAL